LVSCKHGVLRAAPYRGDLVHVLESGDKERRRASVVGAIHVRALLEQRHTAR
jgi:hypothetical protein